MPLDRWINSRLSPPDANGCRLWPGRRDKNGYGIVSEKGRGLRVHRAVWQAAYGETPLLICHRCDVPACGELSHLFAGTPQENMTDKRDKGRSLRGEANPNAKLDTHSVVAMRDLYQTGRFTIRGLAGAFNISKSMVSLIVRNENWTAKDWT